MTNERVLHSLQQGSQEWLAHRANYWNASDAPAAMGVSPYKKRSELLHEKATGIAPEVDGYTQSLFDDGHRFEALARPLAEKIIGAELYPASVSRGKLAASLDGLTMAEDIQWEHKSLNDEIRSATCAAELPVYYRVQMEHQHEVSGAEKTLFQATRWDSDGNLLEEVHFWYESDPQLRQQVIGAWIQFEKDLAEYVPVDIPEKPVASAQENLPTPFVQVSGNIATRSNLDLFGVALRAFIERIPEKPETDQDFADTEDACKRLKAAEDSLVAAEDAALASMSDVEQLRRTVADLHELARQTRLVKEKLVESRKKQIKEAAIAERRQKYADHVADLNKELGDVSINVPAPDFVGAIKNLRTIASLRNSLDTALANGKIAADAAAKDLRAKLDWYKPHAAEYGFLFRDLQTIIQKPVDDFQLVVTTRIDEHKRAEAAKETAQPEATPTPTSATAPSVQAKTAPWIAAAPVSASPRTTNDGQPTLRLGQINERLAPITLTADGLVTLGFKHSATDKNARLYHEDQFPEICAALIRHIQAAANGNQNAADLEHAA